MDLKPSIHPLIADSFLNTKLHFLITNTTPCCYPIRQLEVRPFRLINLLQKTTQITILLQIFFNYSPPKNHLINHADFIIRNNFFDFSCYIYFFCTFAPAMKSNYRNINKLRIRQIGYVFFWSLGLFIATFYGLFDKIEGVNRFAFDKMKEISALNLAKIYLFPLFMAMTLFLLDFVHETMSQGRPLTLTFSKWFVICFIVFVLAVACSVLLNNNSCGWFFFILSWLALSILKLSSIVETEISGTKIER